MRCALPPLATSFSALSVSFPFFPRCAPQRECARADADERSLIKTRLRKCIDGVGDADAADVGAGDAFDFERVHVDVDVDSRILTRGGRVRRAA